jgi:hypothetical protein
LLALQFAPWRQVQGRSSPAGSQPPASAMAEAGRRTLALVNLAAIMERADEALLPAVYREVGAALGATPVALGALTLYRSAVQAACYPLAAYAAVRYNRAHVVAVGAVLWAAATFLVAVSDTFAQVRSLENPCFIRRRVFFFLLWRGISCHEFGRPPVQLCSALDLIIELWCGFQRYMLRFTALVHPPNNSVLCAFAVEDLLAKKLTKVHF